jgi:hypothetical protein
MALEKTRKYWLACFLPICSVLPKQQKNQVRQGWEEKGAEPKFSQTP